MKYSHPTQALPLLSSLPFVLVIGLVSSLLLTGCEEFFEGVVHEVEFPEHEPALAVTLTIDEDAQILRLMVSKTAGVLDPQGSEVLSDVFANLEANGTSWLSLDADDFNGDLHSLALDAPVHLAGMPLRLEVEAEGLDSVSAESTMPEKPVALAELELAVDSVLDPWWEEFMARDRITVDIEGQNGVADWFILELQSRFLDPEWGDTATWWTEYMEGPPDPRVNTLHTGEILVSDQGLGDGDLNQLTFFKNNIDPDWGYPEMEWRLSISALSESSANYLLSMEAYDQADGNPFAEPVVVYSNISSGFGHFGLRNSVMIELE
jgi:hypothetical protein